MDFELYRGDCLDVMKDIPDGSVDMVLTDPPYGTVKGVAGGDVNHGMKGRTNWDVKLDTQAMLDECNRVLRPNGALVLFAQDPYTSELITQAHGNLPFSYRYTWLKDHFANALIAKKAPVNYTEDVLVFFKRHTKHDFDGAHPLREYAKKVIDKIGLTELFSLDGEPWFLPFDALAGANAAYRRDLIDKMTSEFPKVFNLDGGAKYKSNVLEYRKDYSGYHPTQKPVALLEDLISTYTNEGNLVLDFTMGSGTTGVASGNLGRKFIGIELDRDYYHIARKRIAEAYKTKAP